MSNDHTKDTIGFAFDSPRFLTIPREMCADWLGFEIPTIKDPSTLLHLPGDSVYPKKINYTTTHHLLSNENVIHIKIPRFSYTWYNRMQLTQEKMTISGDTIRWRGIDFVRDTKY